MNIKKKKMCDLKPGEVCVQQHGIPFVALGQGMWRWLDRDYSEGEARNQNTLYEVIGKLPIKDLYSTGWKLQYALKKEK